MVTGTRLGGVGVEAAADGLVVGAGGLGLQPRRDKEMAIGKERRTRVRRCERRFTFITRRAFRW
jgi:hypothetical protein